MEMEPTIPEAAMPWRECVTTVPHFTVAREWRLAIADGTPLIRVMDSRSGKWFNWYLCDSEGNIFHRVIAKESTLNGAQKAAVAEARARGMLTADVVAKLLPTRYYFSDPPCGWKEWHRRNGEPELVASKSERRLPIAHYENPVYDDAAQLLTMDCGFSPDSAADAHLEDCRTSSFYMDPDW